MLRIDRLVGALRAASVKHPGIAFSLFTEDGSCLAASDDTEQTQTIGSAAASIFIEFRAAESVSTTALDRLLYRTERRLVCCQHVATLSDGMVVLLIVSARSDASDPTHLQKLAARACEDLAILKDTFAGMAKRFNE